MPTISVPCILKEANTKAFTTPSAPFEKAPGLFQYLKPNTSCGSELLQRKRNQWLFYYL
jgi:hypothetical protein